MKKKYGPTDSLVAQCNKIERPKITVKNEIAYKTNQTRLIL